MRTERFTAVVAADPAGGAVIVVPFDPDEAWGAKTEHHVNGIAEVVDLLAAGVKERQSSKDARPAKERNIP